MQNIHLLVKEQRKNKQMLKDFVQLERKIIHYKFYRDAKHFGHHGGTNTVYKHCVSVGYCAYKLCKLLKLSLDKTQSVVEAALLHDMFGHSFQGNTNNIKQCFLYNRGFNRIKRMHAFYHGIEAIENVSKYIELNDNQRDAIIKHMFPLYPIPPKHIEGWILTLSDKLVATQEVFETVLYMIKRGMVHHDA